MAPRHLDQAGRACLASSSSSSMRRISAGEVALIITPRRGMITGGGGRRARLLCCTGPLALLRRNPAWTNEAIRSLNFTPSSAARALAFRNNSSGRSIVVLINASNASKHHYSFGSSPNSPMDSCWRPGRCSHQRRASPGAGEYWLVDLGSRNGTYVNERRVSRPTPLRDGDRIQIGPFVMSSVVFLRELRASW